MSAEDPRFMETYLENAISVIDHAKYIPKGLFKLCKGVMLITAREGAFLVSSTSGSGVLISHNDDGSWGAPMAIHLSAFGGGATFGYAKQDIVVIMNHFAMDRLLEGRGETSLGLSAGFACGKKGGAVGAEAAISNKGGLGTGFIFTFNKGVLLNVEVSDAMIKAAADVNTNTYGGNVDCEAIVKGKVPIPEGKAGKMIESLHAKLTARAAGESQEEVKDDE